MSPITYYNSFRSPLVVEKLGLEFLDFQNLNFNPFLLKNTKKYIL
jgi:hypothetical protein